jgi:hypothetical protein
VALVLYVRVGLAFDDFLDGEARGFEIELDF